jgi:glycosyltransferase involved in cell wall biosynthesis
MTISIITVVRNGFSTIEQSILGVINQSYRDFEYIIVDGVSTDGTIEIIEKYRKDIAHFISEPDKGIYDAMNKGISLAKGDWIYFLGSDDILYNTSVLFDIFSEKFYNEYDVIYGNVQFLNSHKIYDGKFDYEKLCNRSICHQAIFYRKEVFQKHGFFDIRFKVAADNIFNMKLFCLNSHKWLYLDNIISIFNERATSFILKDQEYLNENFAIRYENFRPFVSKLVLARIVYSSFLRYTSKHKFRNTFKFLIFINKDIGIMRLIGYLPLIFRNKYLKHQGLNE